MGKTDGALLSKYEVSVAGASAITLLPTFVVLFFQIIVDLKTGETNNFRIYFVSGAIFLIFLLLSVLLCLRYAKEIMISRRVLYGGTALLFTGVFVGGKTAEGDRGHSLSCLFIGVGHCVFFHVCA